ncbi:MAG: EamA family transporter [Clostridia bacterium]|nr:EamA family transporter [Clostridia bacterium]MBR2328816.1 EamA family transporter [Clostridia bacterium]MBR4018950.1 EamA family transporter [Clostridia bacterium]
MKNKGVFYALGAGISWGVSLGIFARYMTAFGFTAMQISAVRTTISAITFILLAVLTDRGAFKLHLKDSWIFLCSGFISVTLFCWCYFTATQNCSLAVAGILQYTAPIWVVVLSAIVFKERITKVKGWAMVVAIGGSVLVSGITEGVGNVSAYGLIAGVLSGIVYGLYTIFTRFAVPKYRTMTINVYTFIVASVSSLLMAGPVRTVKAVCTPEVLPVAVIGGIMCAAVPYYLYNKGMETLDNGKASILATIEPVLAVMVSVFIFKEPLSLAAFIGIVMILGAVLTIALHHEKPAAEQSQIQ